MFLKENNVKLIVKKRIIKKVKKVTRPTFSVKLDGDLHNELDLWLQLDTTQQNLLGIIPNLIL